MTFDITYVYVAIAAFSGLLLGSVFTLIYHRQVLKNHKQNYFTREKEAALINNRLISDIENRDREIRDQNSEILHMTRENASLHEKVIFHEQGKTNLMESFKNLSADITDKNSRALVEMAGATLSKYVEIAKKDLDIKELKFNNIVKPVHEALEKYDSQVKHMELSREKAYGDLTRHLFSINTVQKELSKETGNLAKSLRVPHVRGRWGEITLKRVAELSGMIERCDFYEQITTGTSNSRLRPDMIVHLPFGRYIVVDSKVPLAAYLDALDAETDEAREKKFEQHAGHIANHIKILSGKEYHKEFKPAPEFTVLFIPGENFFSAALMKKPELIEAGISKNVILATPTTLISLLKAVSYGWKQNLANENAEQISRLGHELYERISRMTDTFDQLGKDIHKCHTSYNRVIGTLEKRVLVTARKFNKLGITTEGKRHLDTPEQLDN